MATLSSRCELEKLEADWVPEALDYVIVESAAEIRFERLSALPLADALKYPRGTAFGDKGELRWLRRTRGWHMVYLSDAGATLTGSGNGRDLKPLVLDLDKEPLPKRVILWGKREKDGAFREGRIPSDLEYPFGETFSVHDLPAIEIKHYIFPDEQRTLTRFVKPASVRVGEEER